MTQQIAYLEAVVGADITSFRRGMQDVRRETGLLSDTMGGISHLGRNMTLAITAPLLAGAGAAVKLAGSFDASMRNINSIAFLSEDALKSLSDRTLEFGSSIRSGPQAASEALYTVFSAGITDVDKAFTVMQIGAKTAEAGLADLTTTTEGLTAAALTFGDQSDKALQNFSDSATLAVQLGVGSMDTFNTGMANVIGTGAALDDTYQDLAATTAFLSQRGIDFASAGTYLNNAMTKMLKPGEELDALFHQMGVKSGKELISTSGGMVAALREMYKVVGSDETVWAKLFPDARGFKAVSRIFTMFEEDGTDAVSTFFDNFNSKMDEGGVTAAAWEQQMMSFSAQFDMLTSSLQGFGITIGNILLPIITPIINKITEFVKGLSQANPELLKLGVAILAVVAAAGPLLWILGSFLTPIGLLLGAVVGLALAFTTNFGGIRDTIVKAVADVTGDLQPLIDGIKTFFDTLTGGDAVTLDPSEIIEPVAIDVSDFITINPTDKSISLWDFYKGEGFIDKFSWTEFQKMASDAGWNGGAIKPGDVLKLLTPTTAASSTDINPFWNSIIPPPPDMSAFDRHNADDVVPDTSFGGKLSSAIDAAWPTIQTALDTMWTNAKNWFTNTALPAMDTWGGDALTRIAGWFTPGSGNGDSPIYTTLHDLLNGDIGKAAADVGSFFTKNFPEVSKGLTTFFNSVGEWFKTNAVPTVARGLGYAIGSIAKLIGDGLRGLYDMTFGNMTPTSQAGADAAKAGDAIISPFQQGVQDALKDNNVTKPADAFFTSLTADLLAGVAIWTLAPTFFTGIVSKIVSPLFGFISRALMPLTTTIVNGLTSAASAVGSYLPLIAITGIAVALWVEAFNLLINEDARNQAHEQLQAIMDGIFGQGFTDSITERFTAGVYAAMAGMAQLAADISGLMGNAEVQKVWQDKATEWGTWAMDAVHNALAADGGITVDGSDIIVTVTDVQTKFGPTTKPPIGVPLPNANPFDTSTWDLTAGVSPADQAAVFTKGISDSISVATIDPVAVEAFKANMGTALQTAMTNGDYNGQEIVDSFITPLATGFATSFGEEAPATLAWTAFVLGIETGEATMTEKFTFMSQDIALLTTDATKNMPLISAAIIGAMLAITRSIQTADFAAKNLSASLQALNGSTVTITTQVTGGVAAGIPNRASGGSALGMTMVGERGPEPVFFGNKGTVLPTRVLKGAMSGAGEQGGGNATIIVQGVTTVQDFVYEMKRLGYDVEGLKQ